METSGHVAQMTKLAKTYGLRKFVSFLCNLVQLNIPTSSVVCAAYISKNFVKLKKKYIWNRRQSQKLWHFEVSKFLGAFYACLITLDARFQYRFFYISQKRTKTGGHNAKMTKLSKTYGFWMFKIFLCNVTQLNIATPSAVLAA